MSSRGQLSTLVTAVRAETGHALTPTQGLNSLETIKYLLQRTQYELWTAFNWPTLTIRKSVTITPGQVLYDYDPDLKFEQIRRVFWGVSGADNVTPVAYGIPEVHVKPDGTNTVSGSNVAEWQTSGEDQFTVWPTPQVAGVLRFVGNRKLSAFVNDADYSTLDGTLLVLLVAAELLARAKSEDAASKQQKAQRHLTKLMGGQITAKNKVSTLGASRGGGSGPVPYLDYIP